MAAERLKKRQYTASYNRATNCVKFNFNKEEEKEQEIEEKKEAEKLRKRRNSTTNVKQRYNLQPRIPKTGATKTA